MRASHCCDVDPSLGRAGYQKPATFDEALSLPVALLIQKTGSHFLGSALAFPRLFASLQTKDSRRQWNGRFPTSGRL